VQVDGRHLPEPYVVHRGGRPGTFQVPACDLLLLGDHRARSDDARTWREPNVPIDAVLGRVVSRGT
jgi:signal peptidase I